MTEYLPKIGEKCYLRYREVIVIDIWEFFHLVKVKDLINKHLVTVDKCTLTSSPDFTNSISLELFKGERK